MCSIFYLRWFIREIHTWQKNTTNRPSTNFFGPVRKEGEIESRKNMWEISIFTTAMRVYVDSSTCCVAATRYCYCFFFWFTQKIPVISSWPDVSFDGSTIDHMYHSIWLTVHIVHNMCYHISRLSIHVSHSCFNGLWLCRHFPLVSWRLIMAIILTRHYLARKYLLSL